MPLTARFSKLHRFSIDLSSDTLFNVRSGRRCDACVSWPVELDIRALQSCLCLRQSQSRGSLTRVQNDAHGPAGFEQLVQVAQPGLQIGGLAKCGDMAGLFVAAQAPPEVVHVDGATGAVLTNASMELDAAITTAGGQLGSLACTPLPHLLDTAMLTVMCSPFDAGVSNCVVCAVGARGGVLFAAEDPAAEQPAGIRIMASNLPGAAGAHRRTTRYTLDRIEGNALADVQALGTAQSPESRMDAVLTLETAGTAVDGYTVKLFEAYLDSRRDVSGCGSFADGNCSTTADAVEKVAVQDLASLGRCSRSVNGHTEHLCTGSYRPGKWTPLQVDKFKAMAVGPTIADGRRTLLLVNAGDNSTQEPGTTHFVLLALTEEHRVGLHVLTANDDGPLVVVVLVLTVAVLIILLKLHCNSVKGDAEQARLATTTPAKPPSPPITVKFTNPEADYHDSE